MSHLQQPPQVLSDEEIACCIVISTHKTPELQEL